MFRLYIAAPSTYCQFFQMSLFFPFKKELSSVDPLPSLSQILASRFKRRRFLTLRLVRVVVPKAEVKEIDEEGQGLVCWRTPAVRRAT